MILKTKVIFFIRFNFYSKIGRHIMSPATKTCDNVI